MQCIGFKQVWICRHVCHNFKIFLQYYCVVDQKIMNYEFYVVKKWKNVAMMQKKLFNEAVGSVLVANHWISDDNG